MVRSAGFIVSALVALLTGSPVAFAEPPAPPVPIIPPPVQPANIGELKFSAIDYYNSGAYLTDLQIAAAPAIAWINDEAPRVDRPAVVFDIDETSLSNWEALKANDFGRFSDGPCNNLPQGPCGLVAWDQRAQSTVIQPTMDGVNAYFVSWAARQVGLKVALSGLGGDELFAGYSTFADTPRLQRVERAAKFVPGALRKASAGLVSAAGGSGRSLDAARKAAAAWSEPGKLPHAYYFARTLFPPGAIDKLMEPRFRPSSVAADGYSLEPTWLGWLQRVADETRDMQPTGAVSWMEMRSYMTSTLLRDTDSVSMARSLEVRVPLLDTPLVEFVNTLPDVARRKDGVQKALLTEALDSLLPTEITAQKKRTFTLPWEQWLRGPLKQRIEESFAHIAPQIEPLLKLEGVRGVWQEFLAGHTSWSRPWAIFSLNEWARRGGAAPAD